MLIWCPPSVLSGAELINGSLYARARWMSKNLSGPRSAHCLQGRTKVIGRGRWRQGGCLYSGRQKGRRCWWVEPESWVTSRMKFCLQIEFVPPLQGKYYGISEHQSLNFASANRGLLMSLLKGRGRKNLKNFLGQRRGDGLGSLAAVQNSKATLITLMIRWTVYWARQKCFS